MHVHPCTCHRTCVPISCSSSSDEEIESDVESEVNRESSIDLVRDSYSTVVESRQSVSEFRCSRKAIVTVEQLLKLIPTRCQVCTCTTQVVYTSGGYLSYINVFGLMDCRDGI